MDTNVPFYLKDGPEKIGTEVFEEFSRLDLAEKIMFSPTWMKDGTDYSRVGRIIVRYLLLVDNNLLLNYYTKLDSGSFYKGSVSHRLAAAYFRGMYGVPRAKKLINRDRLHPDYYKLLACSLKLYEEFASEFTYILANIPLPEKAPTYHEHYASSNMYVRGIQRMCHIASIVRIVLGFPLVLNTELLVSWRKRCIGYEVLLRDYNASVADSAKRASEYLDFDECNYMQRRNIFGW